MPYLSMAVGVAIVSKETKVNGKALDVVEVLRTGQLPPAAAQRLQELMERAGKAAKTH